MHTLGQVSNLKIYSSPDVFMLVNLADRFFFISQNFLIQSKQGFFRLLKYFPTTAVVRKTLNLSYHKWCFNFSLFHARKVLRIITPCVRLSMLYSMFSFHGVFADFWMLSDFCSSSPARNGDVMITYAKNIFSDQKSLLKTFWSLRANKDLAPLHILIYSHDHEAAIIIEHTKISKKIHQKNSCL